ncbi:flagellar biosynthesis protein FlhA [Clostridium pasteurianum DSM 525 = ATCC 6013]|uniref:Flagellar biosynthesis protein FlhA n=2 Tax=Clostridium pasteurianum TaxID=1501 RepID=A0A0H3J9Q7_CLOPA|nr:flagellar biosynthesis protein FlhA [Clostridium pasteurianum]AJA47900.1 flagellar biosynthesis protein FlhA [Clostridium pasteurianum DSM 525 = ATCC 6013]AJA51888.1 flagellar biosynthesis protein FlhA [Clostridium pasteurianum DSM 525 = ATCC 6013]AOZ75190.1 flagellar biosynthesis protein FlhA [Clostridium pasteurianum DSM 525 = ATCC 6013]AOZ78985.1 flagellar biosynthesis protein FlhA [Clostridium pasteurianum]ELP59803.1 flagellar biosynthesis protein FlhA [Clostridium pasteurianum DSM 525 
MSNGDRSNFKLKNNMDVIVAVGVMLIVLMIIIPLPTAMLDVLIVVNITIATIIILITMFTTEVLQLSVFPTLLLVTTLFRLGLNISSTRLILSQANAGEVINAFGSFVVGGNYIVGIIIFLIIIVIQFIVITNGAGRVAEVAARFALDAMPGKQMSIDADLNAGLIDDAEAKNRRRKIQQEADFYGSMDGASKFVKGDAIASIVIVLINIVAGIVIGAVQMGMPIAEAAQTYVRLTIGDGLVSQIPALLISIATGILVTRSGNDEDFGKQVVGQLTSFPKVLGIAAAILLFLSFIPGLPFLPFFILAVACTVGAYLLYKEEKAQIIMQEENINMEMAEQENKEPENVMNLISVEPMEIEIGYGLIPLADEASGGDLLQRIASVRRQCAIEMGIVVQPIRIRDNLQLKTNEYVVKIRGTVVAKGELMPSMLLSMDPTGEGGDIPGIKTIEPTFGLPAVWINKDQREDMEIKGFTVVDPTTVMVTHLTETIKSHSYELLGRQEVKAIIDSMKERYSAVVEELIPDLMTIGELQKVLQNLLKEKVPIKDMVTILESLADNSRNSKDLELLTEYVRIALGRTICNPLIDDNNRITVATFAPEVENVIANNIQKSMQGSFPAVDPDTTSRILDSIKNVLNTIYFPENQPAILVSPKIRPAVRKLIEMVFPNITVLSLNEVPNEIEIRTEGVVSL